MLVRVGKSGATEGGIALKSKAGIGIIWKFIVGLLAILGIITVGLLIAVVALNPFQGEEAGRTTGREKSAVVAMPHEFDTPQELYLELLKRVLTRYQFQDSYQRLSSQVSPEGRLQRLLYRGAKRILATSELEIVRVMPFDPEVRANGLDHPLEAETMVGLKRLDNLQFCVREVIRRKIPGDLIECGAWRGGSCIFMRAVLKAYGEKERTVWVADSFEGLPDVDPAVYPDDASIWSGGEMAVSLERVKENFARYGMLDNQVRFLKGFFADTLPDAPIDRLAVLRLDGDLYSSTMDTLQNLYPKLSIGGYLIVDDYNLLPARQAVHDYREAHQITEEILAIDKSGVYWEKLR